MIFILTNEKNEVMYRHFDPFDSTNGLGKTEEQLLKDGYLVNSIPESEDIPGKLPVLKYDGNAFTYDYTDIPLSQEQQTLQDLEQLKSQNAQMLMALVEGGLM